MIIVQGMNAWYFFSFSIAIWVRGSTGTLNTDRFKEYKDDLHVQMENNVSYSSLAKDKVQGNAMSGQVLLFCFMLFFFI